MKATNVVIYLMAIAVFEGALHEYLCITASHAKESTYQTNRHTRTFKAAPKKESDRHAWYEVLLGFIHSLWALLAGFARWIWHGMHESVELIMMVSDESELFHDLALQLNMGDGPYHLDMG